MRRLASQDSQNVERVDGAIDEQIAPLHPITRVKPQVLPEADPVGVRLAGHVFVDLDEAPGDLPLSKLDDALNLREDGGILRRCEMKRVANRSGSARLMPSVHSTRLRRPRQNGAGLDSLPVGDFDVRLVR